jgi:hypothetical protein
MNIGEGNDIEFKVCTKSYNFSVFALPPRMKIRFSSLAVAFPLPSGKADLKILEVTALQGEDSKLSRCSRIA